MHITLQITNLFVTKKSVVFNVLLILCTIFFSVQADHFSDNKQSIDNLIFTKVSAYHESKKKINKKESMSAKDRKLNFYVSANLGKVYSDNSKLFINGIKAIRERVSTLVKKNRYDSIIKNIVADEIKSVRKFNGEINFHWLNSISLGCYASKNYQVAFEATCSKIDIKNDHSSSVFDRSANIFAFLFNIYYSPNIQDIQITPYIALGIGPAVFKLKKINELSQNLMPLNIPWFAYQIKFGVNYLIIPGIKPSFGYRYFSTSIPIAENISTHSIEIGLTLNF
ncbi:MAG: P44/Msp2 family outer membrane protein [Wolbachia pipientis]|nr:P44/Msp2 family outer membrane protein [Wolbachia pipientis]